MPTKDPAKQRAKRKRYYERHKDRLRAYGRARYAANPEQCRQAVERWRVANPGYYPERRERFLANARVWRLANPERVRAVAKAYRQRPEVRVRKRAEVKARFERTREWLQGLKRDGACVECGVNEPEPEMYDFDHRPGEEKRFEISQRGYGLSRATVLAELSKCDLVCANCHRKRTAQRRRGASRSSTRSSQHHHNRDRAHRSSHSASARRSSARWWAANQ